MTDSTISEKPFGAYVSKTSKLGCSPGSFVIWSTRVRSSVVISGSVGSVCEKKYPSLRRYKSCSFESG